MDATHKQPQEKFFIDVSFARVLNSGETISLANSEVTAANYATGANTTAAIIEADSFSIADAVAYCRIQGGADGETHKITFKIETDQGNVFEKDILLDVKDH